MAIWIGNWVEPRPATRGQKIFTWFFRLFILVVLLGLACAVRVYVQDQNSGAIRVSFPLLLGFGWIAFPAPNYDPAKADWGSIDNSAPLADGQVIFIRTRHAVYALKFLRQTLNPEQAEFEYLPVGTSTPSLKSVTDEKTRIVLPDIRVEWSGHEAGSGYIYADSGFLLSRPTRYEIGVPFKHGDLETYRQAVPADVHFELPPWKIKDTIAGPAH